jgi:hypothetical protein
MGQFLRALELIPPANWLSVDDPLNQTKPLTRLTQRENTFAGVLGSPRFSNPNCKTIAEKSAKREEISAPLRNDLRVQAGIPRELR